MVTYSISGTCAQAPAGTVTCNVTVAASDGTIPTGGVTVVVANGIQGDQEGQLADGAATVVVTTTSPVNPTAFVSYQGGGVTATTIPIG
jgi:hypothetical protein